MRLKGNAGLQFLHQQNGDNISTYASHFKWKALHSCKIALSCQYTAEFFTFCLEHFIKIPPHMEQNKYCRLQKMWFLGSWQCHLHLRIFAFQIVRFGNEIHNHLVAFMKRADHAAPGFVSPVTTSPSAPALAAAQAGAAPAQPQLLPGQQDMAGRRRAKPWASHMGFGAETDRLAL